jgi:hypothetical protein
VYGFYLRSLLTSYGFYIESYHFHCRIDQRFTAILLYIAGNSHLPADVSVRALTLNRNTIFQRALSIVGDNEPSQTRPCSQTVGEMVSDAPILSAFDDEPAGRLADRMAAANVGRAPVLRRSDGLSSGSSPVATSFACAPQPPARTPNASECSVCP